MVEGRRWAGPGSVLLQPASAQSGRVGGQLEHSGKGGERGGEEGGGEGRGEGRREGYSCGNRCSNACLQR